MKITDHAKDRLRERFKVVDGKHIKEILRRLEKDFVKKGTTENGDPFRIIIWQGLYLEGVIKEDTLITAINRGWTMVHNVEQLRFKERYVNKRSRKYGKNTVY